MPKLRLVGAAIGAFCCAPAHAANYSNAIFFGDSLSDAGSFVPVLPPGTGRFTTNPGPVWSEVLGAELGFTIMPANQGGTDYGARVSELPGFPDSQPTGNATPVATQVANDLTSARGVSDPDAQYAVWAGANDLFTIAPTAASDPAATQAYLRSTAAALATEVARLAAAGARHIIVWNVPDIGATPAGVASGAAGAAGLTQLASGYNRPLAVSLAATGVPVVQLDSFGLLSEVQTDPARYGFANASVPACGTTPSLLCTEASFVAPGSDQSVVFADGAHPTTAGHAVLAQYAASVLRAPAQVSQLAETSIRSQVALSRRLWQTSEVALSTGEAGGSGAWAGIEGGRIELDGDEATPRGLATGIDHRFGASTVLVAALSFDRSEPDGQDGGGFDAKEVALSAYLGWRHGAASVSGHLTLAGTEYDTDRRVRLGAATRSLSGDPDGNRTALGVQAGYARQVGSVHHGPLFSVLLQDVSVKAFSETTSDGSTSATMTYDKQRRRSALVSAGWQVFASAGRWTPFGSIVLSHDAEGADRQVMAATSASPTMVKYDATATADSYATANVGLLGRLGNGLQLGIDLASVAGSDDLDDNHLSASLRMAF